MTIAASLQAKGREVLTAQADQKVWDVLAMLAERRIGALPVIEGEMVVGIISERDVIYDLASEGPAILDKRVDQIMTAPAVTVTREQTALNALALMTRRRIRHLPVVADGRLIGRVVIVEPEKRRSNGIEQGEDGLREVGRKAGGGGGWQ